MFKSKAETGRYMKVIVVGAGIAGLSTAWSLTKAGHAVTLVEQGSIPNPLSASGDHHRIIRRAYQAETGYGALITEAYEAWDELWADLGRNHLDPRGFLCISREEGDEAEQYRDGLVAGGFAFETLEPVDAAARWPFLTPEGMRYAIHSAEGGALHCRAIASDLAGWLRGQGAVLRQYTRVEAVEPEEGAVVIEGGERLVADRVVVTAGAWVTKLFPMLDGPLKTYRTAVAYAEPPADLAPAWATAPVILDVGGETDGYIIPPSGTGGLKFGSGLHKVRSSDADWNREPVEGEGDAILGLFQPPIDRMADYRLTNVVTCAYTFTADETFFCHEEGRALVVSACSGHGYKFGAAVGRRVAQAMENGDTARLRAWLKAKPMD